MSGMALPPPASSKKHPELAKWLNAMRDYVKSITIKNAPGYRVSRTTEGTHQIIDRKISSSPDPLPFEVYESDTLKVKVKGGRIIWHDQSFDIDDSDEITIPSSSTAFKIWIDLADEFAPVPVFASGASGWTNYSDQPNPPARRYMLMAEVDSSSTDITTITKLWNGGDIIWPSIFGVWE